MSASSYDDIDDEEIAVAAAAHAAKLVEAAGTSASPNARFCRRIDDAVAIVTHRSGVRISTDSLRKSSIPRIYVGTTALYADEDLHAFADERPSRAVPHQGPRSPKRRKRTEGVAETMRAE